MKKSKLLCITVLSAIMLSACAKTGEQTANTNATVSEKTSTQLEMIKAYIPPTSLSDDLMDYTILLDEELCSLPVPFHYFVEKGWQVTATEKKELDASGGAHVSMIRDDSMIFIYLKNYSDQVVDFRDGFITWAWIHDTDNVQLELSKGIKFDMTKAELEKALNGIDYEKVVDETGTQFKIGNSYDFKFQVDLETKEEAKTISTIHINNEPTQDEFAAKLGR